MNKINVAILNGPNLNLLGYRENKIYGNTTIQDIKTELFNLANNLKINITFFQSNEEGKLINYIHKIFKNTDFIIINPAAFTHTSIALRDALLSVKIPFIEIHISNIYNREHFRHHSYFSDIAIGVIMGFGIAGYKYALQISAQYLSLNNKNKSI